MAMGHHWRTSGNRRWPLHLQFGDDRLHALLDGEPGSIDDEPRTGPRAVVSFHDLLPRWQSMADDVRHARFDATAMLDLVAANDLNLHDAHAHLLTNSPPCVARERPWIHAVCDNGTANVQVVGSHRMGNGVPLSLHDQPGVSERLLNGIYAEVNGGQRMRQLSGDRRLARAWQTTQDDQHAFTAGLRRARG